MSGSSQHIKRAVTNIASKDKDNFQTVQADYNGKTGNVEVVWPYGFSASAPEGSLLLMFNVLGQEENRAGLVSYPQKRFKELKSGEVMVGNFETGNYTKYNADGDTEIYSKNDLVATVTRDLNIHVTGNLNMIVDGDCDINCTSGNAVNLHGKYNVGGSGGPAIARVGDQVQVGASIGTIITGSTEHTAT